MNEEQLKLTIELLKKKKKKMKEVVFFLDHCREDDELCPCRCLRFIFYFSSDHERTKANENTGSHDCCSCCWDAGCAIHRDIDETEDSTDDMNRPWNVHRICQSVVRDLQVYSEASGDVEG
jgi:hypothetical protein